MSIVEGSPRHGCPDANRVWQVGDTTITSLGSGPYPTDRPNTRLHPQNRHLPVLRQRGKVG
jgi:hypothetical protein